MSRLPVTIRHGTLIRSETILIDRDGVEVEVKGPVRTTRWREELSAFQGVRRRTVSERHGAGRAARHVTRHLVELVHGDKDKTLQLYAAGVEDGVRALWEQAARTLDLPALDETTTGTIARAPEDLDKSIRELAGEGKVNPQFETDKPPPSGIDWDRDGVELHVTIGFRATSHVVTTLRTVAVGFVALLALDNTLVAGLKSVPGIVFAIALAITVEGAFRLLASAYIKRRITVTSKEIRCALETPFGRFRKQSIPIDEVETVRQISIGGRWRIAGYAFGSRDKLIVESDATSISIPNLAKRPRDWIEGFIVAAIAGAPR
jgi:hypothetical protein